MITKQISPTFTTDDGQKFDTIEKAQQHELAVLFNDLATAVNHEDIAAFTVTNRDKVLAILSATGRKPRARKGAKKAKTQPATP